MLTEFEKRFGLGWKIVWREDDAMTPDRERVWQAWERLFNEPGPFPNRREHEYWDGGDAHYYRFGNRMMVLSYPVNCEIREKKP